MSNMNIRIAIVDDMPEERERLLSCLQQMEKEGGHHFSLREYCSGEEILQDDSRAYDIIIFDIDMPGINGMDAARELRKRGSEVVIIFVTKISQYAINGYEVDAVDYVLKPISYFDFAMKMQRAINKSLSSKGVEIIIDSTSGVKHLNTSDLLCVETMLHYVYYRTSEESIKARKSMKQVEEDLSPRAFARCHKSFLVNLRHVKAIRTDEVELSDGSKLPMSRRYSVPFMQEFISFVKG
ncbi:MAG: response regulator transcription factor [Bacilli bacterium]|nr:response regulator transcription factor [Bacilli bacterium]